MQTSNTNTARYYLSSYDGYNMKVVRALFTAVQFAAFDDAVRLGYVPIGPGYDKRSIAGLKKRNLIDKYGWLTPEGMNLARAIRVF